MLLRLIFIAVVLFCAANFVSAQIPNIGPTGNIAQAQMGFVFTEGPAADFAGNVYFSDVTANRIYKVTPQNQLSIFLENTQGINGLMFDGRGRLIACQGTPGRIVAIDIATRAVTVLAAQFNNLRFDRPNDLAVDRLGGVYFTDPVFSGTPVQDQQGVYYIAPNGTVTRLIGNLLRPNGVILSPDETKLYVLHSLNNVMVYPLTAPGQIGAGTILATLQGAGGGDGLTVDTNGNLYVTRPAANSIQVLSSQGASLGTIAFPESPANVTFGGAEMKTLYVTARTSIYTAPMIAAGQRGGTGRKIADFDRDGRTDVSVFRPTNGAWYSLDSLSGNFRAAQFGFGTDKLAPADFDGDGKTDLAVFRAGVWYILRSSDNSFQAFQFGITEDLPVPSDYDGDGRADIAVFRPSIGTWFMQQSASGFRAAQFGASEDKPVFGDYDGDSKTDIAVFRPSNGTWYLLNSTNGFSAVQFGVSSDKPAQSDYDGDGKIDVAVFRPSNGTWYLLQSQSGFGATQFGTNGDVPSVGDYDGDGKSDIAVFRNGVWYANRSAAGFYAVQFGTNGDAPVPAAFNF